MGGRLSIVDSKRKSFTETIFDKVTGFIIYLPINYFVLPLFAEEIMNHSIVTMLAVSLIYTSIAILRKFTIRRWFEKMRIR